MLESTAQLLGLCREGAEEAETADDPASNDTTPRRRILRAPPFSTKKKRNTDADTAKQERSPRLFQRARIDWTSIESWSRRTCRKIRCRKS